MSSLPPLFKDTKEFLVVSAILLTIILARVLFLYQDYLNFKNLNSYYYTTAKVINIYQQNQNKKLLKLKSISDDFSFYLSTNKDIKIGSIVKAKIRLQDDTTFINYLKGFFAYGDIINTLKQDSFSPKEPLINAISKQHTNSQIANFYSAIYLAKPLSKNLRQKVATLGISHLVALSGYHLGILWSIILAVIYLPYRYLQQRYFPYRNRDFDLGIFIILILALFMLFVGSPPSLIRAFIMLLIGWIVLILGLELISFKLLAFSTLLILAIFPKLIVSFSFLLSVIGVFYIFLVLKYFKDYHPLLISLIVIPIGIFVLIFPIAHYLFPISSKYQLLSPILSVIFIPFYPISALLHLLGYGNIFDNYLIYIFNLPKDYIEVTIPTPLIVLYAILSVLSIFNKRVFFITFALALIVTIYSIF